MPSLDFAKKNPITIEQGYNNGSDKVIKIRLSDFAKFLSTSVSNLV